MRNIICGFLGTIGGIIHSVLFPFFVFLKVVDAPPILMICIFISGICSIMCGIMVLTSHENKIMM